MVGKRVNKGDPLKIPAREYNSFVEAAEFVVDQEGTTKRDKVRRFDRDPDYALVRNNTGAAVASYAVLGIDGIVIDPTTNLSEFQQNYALEGGTPSATTHADGKFCIVNEPIPDGKIGRAYVAGVMPVQITGSGEFADIKDGDATQLQAVDDGPLRIIYSESGSGTRWALCRFAGSAPIELSHGIVVGVCDSACNIYKVELAEREFDDSCTGTGTGT